uniref:Lipopolysaccharide export system protein LptC n=1 Tax=Candidatus Kentrum sp. LFY TaxID=2126342 RepID=A0A450WM91_9GAMM|nr:MAG: lipopolysaccharide export system protein LptC [Candidatus Kentron sp. LFY]
MMRRWLLPLWLFVLVVGSSWFLEKLVVDTGKQGGDIRQEEPDYSIDNFTTTAMDKTGQLQYRLKADRMVHYPTADTSELEKPYLIFFDMEPHDKSQGIPIDHEEHLPAHPAWYIEAEEGLILGSGKIVFLLGNVRLWKNNDTGATEIDIRTRNLRIFPDLDYGETDEAITIRTAASETRSVGMRTHIRPSRIELLSQVETIYEQTLRQ